MAAKTTISIRVDAELLAKADEYAKACGVGRTFLIEAALQKAISDRSIQPVAPHPDFGGLSEQAKVILKTQFEAGLDKTRADGCWVWAGAQTGLYQQFRWAGEVYGAHRFSYALYTSPVSASVRVQHLCKTLACVNPDHLFVKAPLPSGAPHTEKPTVEDVMSSAFPDISKGESR